MATGKITLTLEHTDPKHPNSQAMAQTIGLLAQLIDVPTGSIKLAIVCEEEDLQSYADDITEVLSRRPVGIRVKVKKESEDEIERDTMPMVTPMDKAWSNWTRHRRAWLWRGCSQARNDDEPRIDTTRPEKGARYALIVEYRHQHDDGMVRRVLPDSTGR